MIKKDSYSVIGIMSGTSLDGVDMAHCLFSRTSEDWTFEIINTAFEAYSAMWHEKLSTAHALSGLNLSLLNVEYGQYLGNTCKNFIERTKAKPDAICSHGHTIFHQPQNSLSLQIGYGSAISTIAGVPCISDFRSKDVLTGGQGAPLVPIGDKFLFSKYSHCLNIGGIANVSFDDNNGHRIAYDICAANMVLNYLCQKINLPYDDGGKIAKSGLLNPDLLSKLNDWSYYSKTYPKSLGREDIESTILPMFENIDQKDALHTYTIHTAQKIAEACDNAEKLLITGGGAFNSFLVDNIKALLPNTLVVIPDKTTIAFKEAIIFGFLGVLYLENIPNALCSVTGAKQDTVGGVLYL